MNNRFYDRNGKIIDYYTIFNIHYDANIEEIKSAFRSLIKRYHPDTSKNPEKNSIEKIEFIIMGYRILADEEVKKIYDSHLFSKIKVFNKKYTVISKNRIKYSASLNEIPPPRVCHIWPIQTSSMTRVSPPNLQDFQLRKGSSLPQDVRSARPPMWLYHSMLQA